MPGPLRDFSMNRFLAKQVHHLLGRPSGVSNTFSHSRCPVSCRSWGVVMGWGTWRKYWRMRSATSPLAGRWYIPLRGNPGSPGWR